MTNDTDLVLTSYRVMQKPQGGQLISRFTGNIEISAFEHYSFLSKLNSLSKDGKINLAVRENTETFQLLNGKTEFEKNNCSISLIRKENNNSYSYYFKVSGNPTHYITGQYVFGNMDLDKVIYDFYVCINANLKKHGLSLPISVIKAVKENNIIIERLSFTAYTVKFTQDENSKVPYILYNMYAGFAKFESTKSLAESLGLLLTQDQDTKVMKISSISKKDNSWSLTISPKVFTKKENSNGVDYRFSLNIDLNYKWFKGMNIKTLADLQTFCKNDYSLWVSDVFNGIFKKMELDYILSFSTFKTLDVKGFEKDYDKWNSGQNISGKFAENLKRYGLDYKYTFKWHCAVNWLRLNLVMPRELKEAWFEEDEEAEAIQNEKWLLEAPENIKLLHRIVAKLQAIDLTFPKKKVLVRKKGFRDVKSGEFESFVSE